VRLHDLSACSIRGWLPWYEAEGTQISNIVARNVDVNHTLALLTAWLKRNLNLTFNKKVSAVVARLTLVRKHITLVELEQLFAGASVVGAIITVVAAGVVGGGASAAED